MKLDVKDTVSSPDDDLPTPLPTKWNENDRSGGIEVSQDGLDVQFPGRVFGMPLSSRGAAILRLELSDRTDQGERIRLSLRTSGLLYP